jgi:hypothetical protein
LPFSRLFASQERNKAVGEHPKKGAPSIPIRQKRTFFSGVMLNPERQQSAQLSTCSVKRVYTFFTFSADVSDNNVIHPAYFVPKFPNPETKVCLLAIEEICGVKPAESQAKVPSDDHGSPDHP